MSIVISSYGCFEGLVIFGILQGADHRFGGQAMTDGIAAGLLFALFRGRTGTFTSITPVGLDCLSEVMRRRFLDWLRFASSPAFTGEPITLGAAAIVVNGGSRAHCVHRRFVGSCRQWVCRQPQRAGVHSRIDTGLDPPGGFIAAAMDLAMMAAAQRHGEFVADLAAERPVLRKAKVMGIRGAPAAAQTRLLRHKL